MIESPKGGGVQSYPHEHIYSPRMGREPAEFRWRLPPTERSPSRASSDRWPIGRSPSTRRPGTVAGRSWLYTVICTPLRCLPVMPLSSALVMTSRRGRMDWHDETSGLEYSLRSASRSLFIDGGAILMAALTGDLASELDCAARCEEDKPFRGDPALVSQNLGFEDDGGTPSAANTF